MLSRIVRERQREYEEQQKKVLSRQTVSPEERVYPLKLVLMSATLRVEDFISGQKIFRDPPPVMEVPTRQYPVTVHFSKRTEMVDYVGQAYKKILSIHKRLPPGGILVFVTGQREVEYLCQKLRKASKEIVERASKVDNQTSLISEGNTIEENVIKEISEAFDDERSSMTEIAEHFNSYDEDHGEMYEYESEISYDSADDSDLDVYGDDAQLLNQKSLSSDGKLDVLGEEGSLTSLKAAFEALAGKRTSQPDSGEQEGASNESEPLLSKVRNGANGTFAGPMCVLPLYAMLPASAQLRVFEEVKEGERLVVVATNVAETSLTIPGIKYVVDTGREKVKKYNSSNGMEAYEIQFISKASAAQRAGRAGRTGPGHCYRLYSSAVFNDMFFDFSNAEILKVPVDGVVLLLKSMHIDKVANFPFPTPPELTTLVEAKRCLMVLEALDSKGRLTPLGKAMAQYPMSPRHSRMLLTVIQIMQKVKDYSLANIVLAYAVASASTLSLSNPFLMEFEGNYKDPDGLKQDEKPGSVESERDLGKEERMRIKKLKETAKVSRAKFSNPTSDVLTVAYALQCFELSGKPLEFCNDNTLNFKTMEEMSKLRRQLINLVFNSKLCDSQQDFSWRHGTLEDVECAWRVPSNKCPLQLNEEEILGQAICAGWADRVAKRIKNVSSLSESDRKVHAVQYQACLVKEIVFLGRRSSISKSAPEYLVYTELLHSKRPFIQGETSVKENWLVKYAPSLCSFSAPLSDPKPYYDPLNDQVLCWVSPTFGPHLWRLPLHSLPIENDMSWVAVFACSLLEGKVLPCLKSVQKFLAASPASILKPEASGHKRVGNLLNKMRTKKRTIDSCAMLRKLWDDNPRELFSEILDWFQQGFQDHFEDLWAKMQLEAIWPSPKTPTRSHGAGGVVSTPKKAPADKNVAEKGNTEARTKARHDKVKTGTSEVDPEATYLSTEGLAQIQQRACQARQSRPREVPVQIREGASKPPLAKKRKVTEVQEKGKVTRVVEGTDIVWVRGAQVDISASAINKYYRIPAQSDSEYWRREQRPNVNHILEVLCGGSGPAEWQAADGLAKTYINREPQIWLNWVCNRFMPATHKSMVIWEREFLVYAIMTGIPVNVGAILRSQMAKTRKNMQWTLYFVHTLTALLAKHKLTERDDEIHESTESAVHDICSIQDPSETSIKKKGHGARITDTESALQQLRTELAMRDRALLAAQETRDQWMREQFNVLLEAVRGQRQVRHIGIQTDFEEPGDAELFALSATVGTATEVRDVVIGEAAPTREGEMIAAVDTSGVTLEDPSTLRTEGATAPHLQPET
ncbi:atp-dependent rna helicase deah13 [Nicotiana attenuata]|uniref:RNA helicase n=1 Tax=Nicotiana attenuata TaxID=49451 RepID=A0A1J6JZ84_NICAT|nr:atp-dependent rna helicase deah13 [Nicotiana attenuata]